MKTIHQDLKSNKLTPNEAVDVARNRPLSTFCARLGLNCILSTQVAAISIWMNKYLKRMLEETKNIHTKTLLCPTQLPPPTPSFPYSLLMSGVLNMLTWFAAMQLNIWIIIFSSSETNMAVQRLHPPSVSDQTANHFHRDKHSPTSYKQLKPVNCCFSVHLLLWLISYHVPI